MKILNYDLSNKMKNLGYYQLIGGIVGFGRFFWSLIQVGQITGFILFLYLIVIAFFSANIYLGSMLIKGKPSVLGLSKINQVIQIIYFTVSPYGYGMSAGIALYVGFSYIDQFLPNAYFFFSYFYVHYDPSEFYFDFYINIIPFFVIYYIEKIEAGIEKRKELFNYSDC